MNVLGASGLVLGASRPIGLAVARLLASRGVRLALPWYDWPESAAAMEREFGDQGHLCVRVDLRDADQVAGLMARVGERFGGLDLLVNNIERGGMPVVHGGYRREVNRQQWQLEMDTTLHAKWLVFDQALPLLRKRESAAVVTISSIAGMIGRTGPAGLLFNDGYAAANRGVASLTETWARLGAPTVRVNELMLGLIDSRHGPGTRGWELLDEAQRRALVGHTLLGRTGTPDEVARMVLFLLAEADYLTGTVVRMDGGYVLGGEVPPAMPEGVL